MPELKTIDKAITFLKEKILELEKDVEKAKENAEWYNLTGENRGISSFLRPEAMLKVYKSQLHDAKTLLERNMKTYKDLKSRR